MSPSERVLGGGLYVLEKGCFEGDCMSLRDDYLTTLQ